MKSLTLYYNITQQQHFNRSLVSRIITPLYLKYMPIYHISIRFYPGGFENISRIAGLTPSSARRLLALFHKQHNLTPFLKDRLPNPEESINALCLYRNVFKNNSLFMGNLKKISKGERNFTLTMEQLQNPRIGETLGIIGRYTYVLHLKESNFSDLLSTVELNKNASKEKLSGDKENKTYICLQKESQIVEKFNNFKVNYDNNKKITEEFIIEWYNYLETRSPILALTSREMDVAVYLTKIAKDNIISKETFKVEDKDLLLPFKNNANIDTDKIGIINEFNYVESDYYSSITSWNNIINVLTNTTNINKAALIVLGNRTNCIEIDETGNPKITRLAYEYIYNKSKGLLQHLNVPNPKEIHKCLTEKKILLTEASAVIPDGDIVSSAPLLHKNIIAILKNTMLRISMLTSTEGKNNSTTKLGYQEINEDPKKMAKKEYLYSYPRFINFNQSEYIIDLVGLGFITGKNLQEEDVYKKMLNHMCSQENEWGNNPVIELVHITPEVLCKIILGIAENALASVRDDHNSYLKEFNVLDDKGKKKYLQDINIKKNLALEKETEQKYFSSLPTWSQKLLQSIKLFDLIKKQEVTANKKAQNKQVRNAAYEDKQQSKKPSLTFEEKKKKYLEEKAKLIQKDNLSTHE